MYDILRHKHSYAVWTASRAWRRGLTGGSLALAQRLIDVARLEDVRGPDDIGADIDAWLLEKMRLIVDDAAQPQHQIPGITYGRAQKLTPAVSRMPATAAIGARPELRCLRVLMHTNWDVKRRDIHEILLASAGTLEQPDDMDGSI